MKWIVEAHFSFPVEVEASSEKEAREKAEKIFEDFADTFEDHEFTKHLGWSTPYAEKGL
jgi:hypothetical protein